MLPVIKKSWQKSSKRLAFAISAVTLSAASSLSYAVVPELQQSSVAPVHQAQSMTNRIIVKYKNSSALATAETMSTARFNRMGRATGTSFKHMRRLSTGAQLIEMNDFKSQKDINSIISEIMTDPNVEYAEPDLMMHPLAIPTDPRYNEQWHYFETTGGLNLPTAWDTSTGSGAIVGVIDTGYRPHADLVANILPGYDMISDATVARDGNGRDNNALDEGDWTAAGACGPGSRASDSSWHGTHVAGTVGAVANNGIGVAGVAYNAQIVPIRALGRCGGFTSDIADGIIWGAGGSVSGIPTNANPAHVLNLSLGGTGACSATTQAAINTARSLGTTVVVAAGNSNVNASNANPANCNGVITVAATNRNGSKAFYSNFGNVVDVSAPGGETTVTSNGVLSTLNTGTTTPGADTYAYYQTGTVTTSLTQRGNVNTTRFNQALLLDLESDPTGGTCSDTSENGSLVGCSPINIFGEGNISAEGAAFLVTDVSAITDYEQTVASGFVSGPIAELPAGEVSVAIGLEHIANDFSFRPSQDLGAGTIAGFNGSPPTAGSYSVDSVYGEVYIPILRDVPGAQSLDVELAFRSSDYTTVGDTSSYKIAASWAPNDELRFRTGFNTAVRAPNIAELFAPPGGGFPSAIDPCSEAAIQDEDGVIPAEVAAICAATGVPEDVIGSSAIDSPSNQTPSTFSGTEDLNEEEAETITFGVVYTPNSIDGLSLSLDYFDIEIEDAITPFLGGTANTLATCYSSLGGVGSAACNAVTRRADGTIDDVDVPNQNAGVTTLTGYDLSIDYSFDVAGGLGSIAYLGTYTTENETEFTSELTLDCLGKFGNLCGEPIPEYKHRMTFGWSYGGLTTQLLWRFVGSVDDDDDRFEFSVESLDEESYFDLTASYNFNDNYTVNFGIDNIFDETPTLIGDNQEQSNTFPATYDVFGRTFYVSAKASF
ncbi:TonB-dependent receptor domain-containing protein [Sessilibacter corallicola]|uniref:TonB-dependent receptor domain-containing protein n=1 Tax=Sessilibacter corallicola TaxID=2904075 RepID=UPI001E5F47F0|nr:TonB-dependent receptor [Sessilibacter corallicola]MCE2028296.1 TonB-dependent receptor [Sessilibacter corallicola]